MSDLSIGKSYAEKSKVLSRKRISYFCDREKFKTLSLDRDDYQAIYELKVDSKYLMVEVMTSEVKISIANTEKNPRFSYVCNYVFSLDDFIVHDFYGLVESLL